MSANDRIHYWLYPHSRVAPSCSEKYSQVYYDNQGRVALIKEYDSEHNLTACTRLLWGNWNQVRICKKDTRPIGLCRRWLWKMIERGLVQRFFLRPLWRKVFCALFKPDFLVRLDSLDASGNLQEYSLYVYFPDGSLAGVDRYSADGTFLGFLPVE